MANGKRELIEDISDIRRLAGLAEAPKPTVIKSTAPKTAANPDPNNYGSFSTNNNSPYGFAQGGSSDDTAANFFASDKRMRDAQAQQAAPSSAAPKTAAPKPQAPKIAAPKAPAATQSVDDIKDFQRSHGLTPDGIVGPNTRAAGWGKPAPSYSPPVEPRNTELRPDAGSAEKAVGSNLDTPPMAVSPSTRQDFPNPNPGVDSVPQSKYRIPGSSIANPGATTVPPTTNSVTNQPPSPISTPQSRQSADDAQDRADAASRLMNPRQSLPTDNMSVINTPTPNIDNMPVQRSTSGNVDKMPVVKSKIAPYTGDMNNTFNKTPGPQSYNEPTSDDDTLTGARTGFSSGKLTASKNNSIFPHEVIKELYDLANLGEEEEDNSPIPFKYTPSPGLPKTAMTGEKDTNPFSKPGAQSGQNSNPFSKPGAGSRMEKESVEENNMDNQGLPHKDEWEYDREGDMAKDQLHTIVRHAEELERALGDTENLPEWVQEKMAQIKGMMMGVTDYMMTQHERGKEQRTGQEGIHGDDMEEGNEFSGALAQAKANHQDEFEVGGKTYNVREGREVNPITDSLALMKRLAGLK